MNCKISPKAENPRPQSSAPQTRSRAAAAGKLPQKSARRAGNAALCGLQNRNGIYKSAFSIMRPDAVGDTFTHKSPAAPRQTSAAIARRRAQFQPLAELSPKGGLQNALSAERIPALFNPPPQRAQKKAADSRGLSKLHGGRDWIRTSERQSRTDLQSAPFSPLDTLPSCKLGFEHTLRDFRHKLFFQLF